MLRPTSGLVALVLATTGCAHHQAAKQAAARITVPPPGSVPRELDKVMLPPYVIEPPDQLLIQVVQILPQIDPADPKKEPDPSILQSYSLPVQPIDGQFAVRPDGTVYLGLWGAVPVAGLTLQQAGEAIRDHLSRQPDPTKPGATGLKDVRVVIDVLQYNSKRYYVVTDGGGAGEQVAAFPVTGSETVFDAIANIGGLPPVASKRNVWVARRTPHVGQPEQILPVDWVGITQYGVTTTNYQIMPGDRVYVKAQRLVTLDTTLARIFTPIERVFGITLLGASTVNQIQGRGQGFGN